MLSTIQKQQAIKTEPLSKLIDISFFIKKKTTKKHLLTSFQVDYGKTTPFHNKVYNFECIKPNINFLLKYIIMITTSFLQKINLPTTSTVYILLLFFVTGSSISIAQNRCLAKIQVEKNRNSRSLPPGGTKYIIEIANEGSMPDSYQLQALNITSNCSNNDGSPTSANVNLTVNCTDFDNNIITEIVLNPGETKSFLAKVSAPEATPYNRWNCTQIIATSKECTTYSISTILHTIVTDPTQD